MWDDQVADVVPCLPPCPALPCHCSACSRELQGADFLIKTVTIGTPTQARTAAPAPAAKTAASSRTESGNKAAAPAPTGKSAAPAPAAKAAPESGNKAAAPAATTAPKAAG